MYPKTAKRVHVTLDMYPKTAKRVHVALDMYPKTTKRVHVALLQKLAAKALAEIFYLYL